MMYLRVCCGDHVGRSPRFSKERTKAFCHSDWLTVNQRTHFRKDRAKVMHEGLNEDPEDALIRYVQPVSSGFF